MTTKQRTKLELIRIEGICRMLLKKVEEEHLVDLVEDVTKTSSKDIRRAIFRLPRYQLIEVIERAGSAITDGDIDDAYEQYRYGLKPGFTLFSINHRRKKRSEASAYNAIADSLAKIPYDPEENIKSIAVKAHSKIGATVIEYSFSYLNKHSFLTEKEEPAFVYEYEECFAWIDVENGFLAIKNAPDKVLTILKRAFSDAYDTQFTNIKLTQKLIHDIFGDDNIKKGSFIKPNASIDEAEKLVVSDSRFSEKQAVQNSVSGYDMTGTYLNEAVGDGQTNTLGINCEKGKLYLTSNVSATAFREWSVRRISSIISYLSNGANFSDFDVFKAKNITDSPVWEEYNAQKKSLIEKVCYAVYVASNNKQDNAPLACDLLDLRTLLKSSFIDTISAFCNVCNEPFFPRCTCGSSSIIAIKTGRFTCIECGKEVDIAFCDEGHNQRIVASEALGVYPTNDMLKKIAETLKSQFGINLSGSFYIHNGNLTLLADKKGGLVSPGAIPELKAIADIELTPGEYRDMLSNVQIVKEKCRKSTNKSCNDCRANKKVAECMMLLFTNNVGYRPSPHQAGEFGDVSFTVTLDGASCQLVGIAKSSKKGQDVLNLSEPAAREMLQQVLSATHDARIGIIAAICPTRFHDQLTEELRYIAKLAGKPIVILDDEFMARQFSVFEQG